MSPPRKSPALRLQQNSKRVGDCILWTGSKTRDGYGVMGIGRNGQHRVHRIAYQLATGESAEGRMVCHRCDTPLCINPEHLFLGTAAENTSDMLAKGRHAVLKGQRHPNAKLTDLEVDEIKMARGLGCKLADIAKEFSVSFQHVSLICRGGVRCA